MRMNFELKVHHSFCILKLYSRISCPLYYKKVKIKNYGCVVKTTLPHTEVCKHFLLGCLWQDYHKQNFLLHPCDCM